MRRPGLWEVAWAGLGLAACVAHPPPPAPDSIAIGALLPFTGDLAASGNNLERGILWAVESINSAGGIHGRPVRVISRDTHSDVERGLQAVSELLDEGVLAIVGPEDANLAKRMAPLLAEREVPHISGALAPSNLAVDPTGVGAWVTLSDSKIAGALSRRMYDDGIRRVSLVAVADELGRDFTSSVESSFGALGGNVVRSVSFPPGLSSYAEILATALAPAPEALILVAYPTTGAVIVQEWATRRGNERWYFAPMLRDDAFVRNVSPHVLDGMIGASQAVASNTEEFATSFAQRWSGEAPLVSTHYYYDATALLLLSLAQVTSTADGMTGVELRARLRSISTAPGTLIGFDELPKGLRLVESGRDVEYHGASGSIGITPLGRVDVGLVEYWTVDKSRFVSRGLVRVF